MSAITLNFIPLAAGDFSFPIFRSEYDENTQPSAGQELATLRKLPAGNDPDRDYRHYWTTFEERPNAEKVLCGSHDNNYVTIDMLRRALITKCHETSLQFRVVQGFRRHVEVTLNTYPEGDQVVQVEPYYLKSKNEFGFLLDLRFHPKEEHRGTTRALQRGLALDQDGHPNRNHYADRYDHLLSFIRKFHKIIFPLQVNGGEVAVADSLSRLDNVRRLESKRYVVGNSTESSSQFMGVKNNGPLKTIKREIRLYFVYLERHLALSRDLYRALHGKIYQTFSGMGNMFRTPISSTNVRGIAIHDFDMESINVAQERISLDRGDRPAVAVVLTPFSRRDNDQNDAYWTLKHSFLSAGIPIQVVSTNTANDRSLLKWSTASIGLQIFAKLGGEPWKVRTSRSDCLIVGVGQAHHVLDNGGIDRYFAYSVLTDSSGVFREVRVLGKSDDEESYMQEFSQKFEDLLRDYSSDFSTFAIHATFTIRQEELRCMSEVFLRLDEEDVDREFVAMKFNERNRFAGFDVSQNSRVPYESSVIGLGHNEFLVWFEGLQYNRPSVSKMVGGPMHVKFIYPSSIKHERKMAFLQDAVNLSGANWRGFNAKSLPVSVYYAQIIARYLNSLLKIELSGAIS